MPELRREQRSGSTAIETLTALLQRRRLAHPTKGLYEAAELQRWWSKPLPTDDLGQLFWFDVDDQPEAAAAVFDFSGGPSLVDDNVTFCPFGLDEAAAAFVAELVDRGLALASSHGFTFVDLEVEQSDAVMQALLADRGFAVKEPDVLIEAWLSAEDGPGISPLHEGDRPAARSEKQDHAEFDLVVIDREDNDAGHCLFWFDPVTSTGVVEPMRVNDDHQRRGLARHLVTAGLDLLARAGATRVSIGYEPDNPASGHLHRSVGFEDTQRDDLYSGPTARAADCGHR